MNSLRSFASRLAELLDELLLNAEYYYKEARYYLIRKSKYFIQRGVRETKELDAGTEDTEENN